MFKRRLCFTSVIQISVDFVISLSLDFDRVSSTFKFEIMDPKPSFPFECQENLLYHLSGSDLLECSLVCPEWNYLIGSTNAYMKKIALNFSGHVVSFQIKRILMDSNRKYQYLKLDRNYSEKTRGIVSAKERKWTHVTFNERLEFTSNKQFLNFLRIFQGSVESLVMKNRLYQEYGDLKHNFSAFQFP